MTRMTSVVLGVACTLAAVGTAGAQQVEVVGSATGCFYVGSACTTGLATDSYNGATFYASTFDDFTNGADPNRVSFGGNAMDDPTNFNNLGSIFLATAPGTTFNGSNFNLFLTFTQPGSASQTFTAALTGQVTTNPLGAAGGSLHFAFTGGDQTFTYDGGQTATVHVNDLDINPGQTQALSGNVTVTTPEPSSMALLGTGLFGLVPMIRRRRK